MTWIDLIYPSVYITHYIYPYVHLELWLDDDTNDDADDDDLSFRLSHFSLAHLPGPAVRHLAAWWFDWWVMHRWIWRFPSIGFHQWGYPNSWMVYFTEHPKIKWMFWGYPHFRKPSYLATTAPPSIFKNTLYPMFWTLTYFFVTLGPCLTTFFFKLVPSLSNLALLLSSFAPFFSNFAPLLQGVGRQFRQWIATAW